jgi:signal transduction histidine kinase
VRRRLVVMAAATTLTVALAFLVPLAAIVSTLARDRALSAAELEAQSLAAVLAVTTDPTALDVAVRATKAGANGRLTIFLPDGSRVGAPAPARSSVELARRGRAFSTPVHGGVDVFVPVVLARGPAMVIRVFVPEALLSRGVKQAWALEAALGLVLVLMAVFMADRMARSVVRPVRAMAGAARRLGRGDLSVRVKPEGPPEVVQVAKSFNRLGHRVGELLAAERELVADLSHRLRTPLTALRLDADGISDPEDARRISQGLDELEEAVNAMIHQARQPVRDNLGARSDAGEVARSRVAFWAPLAEDQGRRWSIEVADGTYPVPVTQDDLEAALDALLNNVFAHTGEHTPFKVAVSVAPEGGTRLAVEDAGPGLSEDLVARGVSGAGSTGLGLDIARRTAEAGGGGLRIGRAPWGGALIELAFPPISD